MRKILIITPFYPPNIGGAETFIEALVKEAKQEFNITVLTFKPFKGYAPRVMREYTNNGKLSVIRLDWLFKNNKAWQGVTLKNLINVFPKMLWHAYFLNRKYKFDTIHAQGLISGLVGALIVKPKQKLLLTLLAMYKFYGALRIVSQWILNKCDKIFVEGDYGRSNIKVLNPKGKIIKFRHWCDHDIFTLKKIKRLDKIRILFIGRPMVKKGMDIIKDCENKINDPNVEFQYVTKVEYKKLPEIYRRSHILCVPSQYDEGHSRVVIEGASSGCAVITSDRGALPEQVEEYGLVARNNEFAEMLSKLVKDKTHLIYSAMAHQYAKKYYTKKNAQVFLNEY